MPPEPLLDSEINEKREALLSEVPESGEKISNAELREKLGWDDDVYWMIRDRLVDDGLLRKRRGRGGAVERIVATESDEAADGTAEPAIPTLYPPKRHPRNELPKAISTSRCDEFWLGIGRVTPDLVRSRSRLQRSKEAAGQ